MQPGQMLLWGETAQGHIRAVVIVGPHPLRGAVLNFFNAGQVSMPPNLARHL